MYLTFMDYQSMGGKLGQPQFIQAEFIARKRINELTFSRIADETPVRNAVKMCVFGLIERGYFDLKDETSISGGVGSVSQSRERNADRRAAAASFIRTCLTDELKNGQSLFSLAV